MKSIWPEVTDDDKGCHSESQEPCKLLKAFKIKYDKEANRNEDKKKPQIVRYNKEFTEWDAVIQRTVNIVEFYVISLLEQYKAYKVSRNIEKPEKIFISLKFAFIFHI